MPQNTPSEKETPFAIRLLEQRRRLDRAAARTGQSRPQIIRAAVASLLDRYPCDEDLLAAVITAREGHRPID